MAQSGQRAAIRAQSRATSLAPTPRRDADRDQSSKQKRNTPNNEATIAYIKKILCSRPPTADTDSDAPTRNVDDASLEELLPPLTSSNEVDVQLYALIAVILSNFVQTWYNRITPDQQFVGEIVQIIAHCTRGLEQRLRKVDLEGLLLDEVPDLVATHVKGKVGTNAWDTVFARKTDSRSHQDVQSLEDRKGNGSRGVLALSRPQSPRGVRASAA